MTDDKTLTKLLAALDADAPKRARREQYLSGRQPLAYLAPEARTALANRFSIMAVDVPRCAVNALAERLRVTGFTGEHADTLWADWLANDMDQMAPVATREALGLGEAFVIVWGAGNRPVVTVESSEQVAVVRDPATRQVVAAVKRWEAEQETFVVVFEADKVTKLRAPGSSATTTAQFTTLEVLDNPLGVVPVVPLRNSERLLGAPASEVDPLMPLVDALNKALTDAMVASEYTGRPRRWATGVELEEEPVVDADGEVVTDETGEPITQAVNPYPEGHRMMISEAAEAKFGQLEAARLDGYESLVRVIQAQISAVSGLPPHYLGVHGDQPASADALRASEASLVAKAEAKQAAFGRAWEQVARLMVAVRLGIAPEQVVVAVQWADPATRSVAQEADAVVKLFAAGLLPASFALKRLGYSDDEVQQIRAARRAEALDSTGTDLVGLVARHG